MIDELESTLFFFQNPIFNIDITTLSPEINDFYTTNLEN